MRDKDGNGWAKVAAFAGSQHGRVTARQLGAAGFGRERVRRAAAAGQLHREHRGVYAVGHQAPSELGRWMSAVLACGAGAALSHRSAAALWGIRDGEGRWPDVTSPRHREHPRIANHRAPTAGEVAECHGVPVTTVARTLVDLAHVVDPDALTRAVREAQYRRRFNLVQTRAAAARRPSAALNRILEDFDVVSTSWLEDGFIRLVDRHRIPRPTGQRRIGAHRVDFSWDAQRVVAELDGAAAHLTLDGMQRGLTQTNRLQLAGWIVLRFSAADLRRRPRETAQTVRAALSAR